MMGFRTEEAVKDALLREAAISNCTVSWVAHNILRKWAGRRVMRPVVSSDPAWEDCAAINKLSLKKPTVSE
jgi:hypothetical protein